MKLIHCADLHLREKDIEECGNCLDFLVATAREEAVELAVIAGDIFDSQDVEMKSKTAKLAVKTISELANIAPVCIVLGTSSHDGTAPEILGHVRGNFPVIVADKPMQVYLSSSGVFTDGREHERVKAVITLIPQPTKQYFQTAAGIKESDQEIALAMADVFRGFGAQAAPYKELGVPHVLGGHWNVSGSKLPTGQVRIGMDIEISIDQMMLALPDLGLLGHIHEPQQIGDRFFFSGPLYCSKIDEKHPGFWIHEKNLFTHPGTIDLNEWPKEEWLHRFFPSPCKKTTRLIDDFSSPDNDHRGGLTITDCLIGGVPVVMPEVAGTYVRHEIKVFQDEAVQIDKAQIEKFYLEAGALEADVRIVRVPRQNVRSESVLRAENLRDKIVASAELKGERVPESILLKADLLKSLTTEELLKIVTGERTISAERNAA